jgi:hypothetical protein
MLPGRCHHNRGFAINYQDVEHRREPPHANLEVVKRLIAATARDNVPTYRLASGTRAKILEEVVESSAHAGERVAIIATALNIDANLAHAAAQ